MSFSSNISFSQIQEIWNENFWKKPDSPLSFVYDHWGYSTLFMSFIILFIVLLQKDKNSTKNKIVLISLCIYLIHQFEEHCYPGSFGVYVNSRIFNSPSFTSPIPPSFIFWVNSILIWALFLYCYDNEKYFWLPVFICLVNGIIHVAGAVAFRGYNPGLITAVTLLIPYSVYILTKYKDINDKNNNGIEQDSNKLNCLYIAIGIHILLSLSFFFVYSMSEN